METNLTLQPIGWVRGAPRCKHHLPKQPIVTDAAEQQQEVYIELCKGAGYEQALQGLEGFDYLWVIFWMDRAHHYCPKVRPPGMKRKVGVFATRSPHRPNPIGISCVQLRSIEGLKLSIVGCDMLEGTPVFDIKPYIDSADARCSSQRSWIAEREEHRLPWRLEWSRELEAALELLQGERYLQRSYIEQALQFGPYATSSNRLRAVGTDSYELALGPWRLLLHSKPPLLYLEKLYSGYRSLNLISDPIERIKHERWLCENRERDRIDGCRSR